MSAATLRRLIGLATAAVLALVAGCASARDDPAAGGDAGSPPAIPPVVTQWANAWNDNRPDDMAVLFTPDAVYEDLAFQATWRGPDQIRQWVTTTHEAIGSVDARVDNAFQSADHVAVTWTFSGHLRGAPRPFAVPATTVMRLSGGRIAHNSDYYNLAALLEQSGLPAEWPPAA